MAISSLEHLCAGFCELAQVPAPALTAHDQGLLAFNVVLRDVTVDVLCCPEICADHAFILFEFGAIGQDGVDFSAGAQALLQANFLALRAHPAVLGQNPVTGRAVLQYVYPFRDATATGLFDLVNQGVESALEWRRSGALRLPAHGDLPVPDDPMPTLASFA